MIMIPITYTDFDGVLHEKEPHYFNISKPEMVEMQRSPMIEAQSFYARVSKMDDPDKELTNDEKDKLLNMTGKLLRDIVSLSYGERSEDGKRFIKNDHQKGAEFIETAAYDELYMDMISNPRKFFDFVKAVIPADVAKDIEMPTIPEAPEPSN